jgi:hypothetical protein
MMAVGRRSIPTIGSGTNIMHSGSAPKTHVASHAVRFRLAIAGLAVSWSAAAVLFVLGLLAR